jgi:hypothetical protein
MGDASKYKPAKPFTCIANSQRELARNAEFNYNRTPTITDRTTETS